MITYLSRGVSECTSRREPIAHRQIDGYKRDITSKDFAYERTADVSGSRLLVAIPDQNAVWIVFTARNGCSILDIDCSLIDVSAAITRRRKYKLSLTQERRNGYAMWSEAAVISSRNPGTSISINLATFPASWLARGQFCLRYPPQIFPQMIPLPSGYGYAHASATVNRFIEIHCVNKWTEKRIGNVSLLEIARFSPSLYIRFFNEYDVCLR